jgi:ABC-type phosphate transport system substrate-binding protein
MVRRSHIARINRFGCFALLGLALNLAIGAALADVVAVVSAKSAVANLTKEQLTDIFLGKVNTFPNGARAVPIDQREGSVARNEFYAKFAGKSAAQVKAYWAKIIFTGRGQPPDEVADGLVMKKRISENLSAIGYIEENMVDDSVKVVRESP